MRPDPPPRGPAQRAAASCAVATPVKSPRPRYHLHLCLILKAPEPVGKSPCPRRGAPAPARPVTSSRRESRRTHVEQKQSTHRLTRIDGWYVHTFLSLTLPRPLKARPHTIRSVHGCTRAKAPGSAPGIVSAKRRPITSTNPIPPRTRTRAAGRGRVNRRTVRTRKNTPARLPPAASALPPPPPPASARQSPTTTARAHVARTGRVRAAHASARVV